MATPETDRGINIKTLSCKSPENNEELVNLLDNYFGRVRKKSLIVLPEYFIHGEQPFGGRSIDDTMVTTLLNFSETKNAHIVAGMIEQTDSGDKYVTGLFISPSGLIDTQRKSTPTSFEKLSGIVAGYNFPRTFKLENSLGTLSIVMCIESFRLDQQLRGLTSDIFVNPRGFDLDDPKIGYLRKNWLLQNRDLAMMGKRYVVGATGFGGQSGSLAEIIDFEGNILKSTLKPDKVVSAFANFQLLKEYREGKYKSKIVPHF
ncbi:MAG TPA: nitrilase-related carbon-nitrogen hydrolase [Candidatus Saccharimonadales bacterium]|jgi:predicted amidohydrolase|nr:nitrilase-related carbon-nitrogen hydrolase [Candidatus Saccharimonadales bacterium]